MLIKTYLNENLHKNQFMTEHKSHLECANSMFVHPKSGTVYVGVHAACDQIVNDDEKKTGFTTKAVALYVSESLGLSFSRACYPMDLTEKRFSIREESADDPILLTAFLYGDAQRKEEQFTVGSLFVSDHQFKSVFRYALFNIYYFLQF